MDRVVRATVLFALVVTAGAVVYAVRDHHRLVEAHRRYLSELERIVIEQDIARRIDG